jgi:Zn-dependent protease with chaperone function
MDSLIPPKTINVQLDGSVRELSRHPEISGAAFQHPDDRAASQALEHIPFFSELFKFLNGNYFDQKTRMEHLLYNMRLGPSQGAPLYSKMILAAQVLDIDVVPELYLSNYPLIYTYSSGVKAPSITLSQGCLTMLSEAEQLAWISHELGHLKCQHGTNRALATIVATVGASGISTVLPVVGTAAVYGMTAGLTRWSQMAEFSADRAALLVVQDAKIVASAIAKMAGFHEAMVPDFNFDALIQQLDDYARYDQNEFQSLIKLQKVLLDSLGQAWLPSPILRIKRILDWGESDHYKDIMTGDYLRET